VRIPDLARAFKFGVKGFKKRLDHMEKHPELFGCTYRLLQEGKFRVSTLFYTGKPIATAAGARAGAAAAGDAKRTPAEVLRAARCEIIRRHVAERGYAVKAYMGRWLAQEEGGAIVRVVGAAKPFVG
jgi:hypothetical protein